MSMTLAKLGEAIADACPEAVISWQEKLGELRVDARRERLLQLMRILRDDPRFAFAQLMDLCGVDWPDRPERFEVVYNLLAPV
ncbi:MAG: NADH-quinone oxidoreductase subunit C, partial [Elioraea sp.]|nr:NADH-quinone oxidoreductase subunit C [Elioraea sp.]